MDYDFYARLELLVLLMQDKKGIRRMKKLQREALKHYPLEHPELIRFWMSWRVGLMAAELCSVREGLTKESPVKEDSWISKTKKI